MRAAQRVQLQRRSFESHAREKVVEHDQDFGVYKRIAPSERLSADLMKLAHPSLLRPLTAEHRSQVEELSHRLDFEHLGFHVRAYDPGGALRPERE